MTNKSYFKSLCGQRLNLGLFYVEFDKFQFHFPFSEPCFEKSSIFDFKVYSVATHKCFFHGSVILTSRCIHTKLFYSYPDFCKFSPWELNEWCPAVFLPLTNYLHWQKYMRLAFEIFSETNPKLLQK